MKKLIMAICFVVGGFLATDLNAQTFQEGSGVLNATIGLGNALYSGFGYTSTFPPLAASYEVGVMDNLFNDGGGSIGVGGYLGISGSRWRSGGFGYNYTNIVLGPRGIFHYQFVDRLDTYAGLLLGWNIQSYNEVGNIGPGYSNSGGGFVSDVFLGARYYFNENVAGVAELGFGISYFNVGAAFKLR